MPRRPRTRKSSKPRIAGDLTVHGRINELLDGRATPDELIAEGVLVDLTAGPTAKAWSDALPDGEPVFVTRGVWDIIQQAVRHPDSQTDLDTVVYDLLWMCQPKPEAERLMMAVALSGVPFPYVPETGDAALDTRLMELRRRYAGDRVFVCWIPTDPRSEFANAADTHIFRMVVAVGDDGDARFLVIMTPAEG
jgi:hypothetical protein